MSIAQSGEGAAAFGLALLFVFLSGIWLARSGRPYSVEGKNASANLSEARLVASVFGVLARLGGITHSVGEAWQGNVAPSGLFMNSWAEGPIASHLGGRASDDHRP